MNVNLDTVFKTPLGNDVISNGKRQNVGEVLALTLFNSQSLKGQPMTPEQKYMAFRISQKMASDLRNVTLNAEEVMLIKEISAEMFSSGAYGTIVDLIDPQT